MGKNEQDGKFGHDIVDRAIALEEQDQLEMVVLNIPGSDKPLAENNAYIYEEIGQMTAQVGELIRLRGDRRMSGRESSQLQPKVLEKVLEDIRTQSAEINQKLKRAKSPEDLVFLLEWSNLIKQYSYKLIDRLIKTDEETKDLIGWGNDRNQWKDEIQKGYTNILQASRKFNAETVTPVESKLLEDIKGLSKEDIQNLKISPEKRKKISLIHDYLFSKNEIQKHWENIQAELNDLDQDNDLEKSAYNVAVEMASFAATSKIQLLMAAKMPLLEKIIGKKKSRLILMSLASPIKASLKAEITNISEREGSIEESNEAMKKALKKSVLEAIDGADYIDSDEFMEDLKSEVDQAFESIGVSEIIKDIDTITNNIPVVRNLKTMVKSVFKTVKAPVNIIKFEANLKQHEDEIQKKYEFLDGEIQELLDDLGEVEKTKKYNFGKKKRKPRSERRKAIGLKS